MEGAIEIGARGERAAAEYLRRNGFLIMETNWRSGHYEIDIIAGRGDRVHFVEVKYRKSGSLTTPEDALTPGKGKFLLRAANDYISIHGIVGECSIDLIAIDAGPDGTLAIRYIPGAVDPRW